MKSRPDMRAFLLHLGRAGYLKSSLPDTKSVDAFIADYNAPHSFWTALAGTIGAFIGLCFLGVAIVLAEDLFGPVVSYVLTGVLFLFLGVKIDRQTYNDKHSRENTLMEDCINLALVGGAILAFKGGIIHQHFDRYAFLAEALLVFCIVYPFVQNQLVKFWSSVNLFATWLAILTFDVSKELTAYAFYGVVFSLLAFCICFVLFRSLRRHRAMFYAALMVLWFAVLYLSSQKYLHISPFGVPPVWPFIVVVCGSFIGLVFRISAQLTDTFIPAAIASCGVISLGQIGEVGIVFSLGIIVLGLHWYNKMLRNWGALSLVGFLVHYYYALNLTLLEKSYILFASGAVLLVGCALIKWRGWNKSAIDDSEKFIFEGEDE